MWYARKKAINLMGEFEKALSVPKLRWLQNKNLF